jgi:hypothetical protein
MLTKTIQYSRHAKRRMKLYKITEADISFIIERWITAQNVFEGKHEIISNEINGQQGYPIKVVFSCDCEKIVVIKAYPLKKELKK